MRRCTPACEGVALRPDVGAFQVRECGIERAGGLRARLIEFPLQGARSTGFIAGDVEVAPSAGLR
jgi:hypothetical protein